MAALASVSCCFVERKLGARIVELLGRKVLLVGHRRELLARHGIFPPREDRGDAQAGRREPRAPR